MTFPNKISLIVRDFNIPTKRIDTWVTEAIKLTQLTTQHFNFNNLSFSRNKIKHLIEQEHLKVDGKIIKDPSFKVLKCKIIQITFPEVTETIPIPQNIKLDVIFEDEFIIVINKEPGIVVHPAPGSPDKTLVNALLYHCGESLQGIGGIKRPGIVHRLDKNTSGVIVVAKTELAHVNLCNVFSNHDIERKYNAIVWGQPVNEGIIKKPIGRLPVNRKKMGITQKGKYAFTKWKLLEIYPPFGSLIECKLETGRTHQIRVHLADMGHGIVGDDLYGRPMTQKNFKNNFLKERYNLIKSFPRQALHATKLCLKHPINNKYMEFSSNLPKDMTVLISNLKV